MNEIFIFIFFENCSITIKIIEFEIYILKYRISDSDMDFSFGQRFCFGPHTHVLFYFF